jgi:hypothetical protein
MIDFARRGWATTYLMQAERAFAGLSRLGESCGNVAIEAAGGIAEGILWLHAVQIFDTR